MARSTRMEALRGELITSVIDHAEDALKRAGIDSEKAIHIATSVADNLVDMFGGQNICFPNDYRFKLAQKEASVYAQFTGTNFGELASAHGMTERGMRKLIVRARARSSQVARS